MQQKFVVRLLDASDRLLAWAEVYASPKPQATRASCPFFAIGPTQFVIEQNGIAAKLSVHWCDLDIARVTAILGETRVSVGQVYTYHWIEPIWLVAGMQDVPLPAVTVRGPIAVGVPVGGLNAVSPR